MLYLKAWHNLGFVRDPFLLVRAQLPIWDTTCAATITMAPSDRQDKKPKDASAWLWTAPRNSVSLSIYTLPTLLLVNMHASNIQQNQAWAFVSVLCRVLYYAMIEWQTASSERQNLRAKSLVTHKSTCVFMRVLNIGLIFKTQPDHQLEFTKNPIADIDKLIRIAFSSSVYNSRLISYFSPE